MMSGMHVIKSFIVIGALLITCGVVPNIVLPRNILQHHCFRAAAEEGEFCWSCSYSSLLLENKDLFSPVFITCPPLSLQLAFFISKSPSCKYVCVCMSLLHNQRFSFFCFFRSIYHRTCETRNENLRIHFERSFHFNEL